MVHRFAHTGSPFILITSALFFCACSNVTGLDTPPEQATQQGERGPVVARLNGNPIYQARLDQWLKEDWLREIAEDPTKLYQLRRAGVDGVIDDALIEAAATKQGLTSDAFLEQESATLEPVTDKEVDEFYARNKDRIRPAEPLDQLRPKIRLFLEEDRPVRVVNALREAAEIEILMIPPPAPPVARQSIPPGGAVRGPIDAPVTIVEFSDYQCPFCRRAEETLHQIDALYRGKIRFEFRHLPLDFHPNALPAAKAAVCAEGQERFWDYHGLLFANQNALTAQDLLRYASQLELDPTQFQECLRLEATLDRIKQDVEIAKAAGATATPTFFINGILLRGAQEADAFRSIIDREIAQHAAPQ